MLKCSRCQKFKSHNKFYIDRSASRGRCYECIECQKTRMKEIKLKEPIRIRKYCMDNMKRNVASWKGFIPEETDCECCGKRIKFLSGKKASSIHFDHRHGLNLIKNPISWLWKHVFNEKNKAIWESCDFGMLCDQCNRRLPTENRSDFLKNACQYHFGEKNIHALKGSTSVESERKV